MQRLNEQDALIVHGEATGWPLHLGSLQVYDVSSSPEGLDLERVRDLFRQRLPLVPAFRHRLVRVPGGLDRPVWVADPDVDVASHIHGVRLPAPGTDQQLAQLVGSLTASFLDPTRPPWEMWVIEGLQHERVAVLARLHHAAGDGVRGLAVQAATYDVDPTAPLTRGGLASGAGEAVPGALRLLGEAAVHLAGAPLRMARTAGHLARATARLAGVVRRGEDGALALPLTAPRTSLNRRISSRRGFAFCSLPLTPVKQAKVNDVVLALVSGGLRRYLDAPGELPARSLVAAVPVGLPDDGAAGQVGGNRWAVVLASLASDLADPVERLHRIAASARTGKRAQQAIGSDLWHELFDVPPAGLGRHRARLRRPAPGGCPPGGGERRGVQPARRALPALHGGRAAAGQLPDGADRRRAGAEHHRHQLPRLPRRRTDGLS
jgi:WS/DGAT/MGAT family acyltransferase